LQVLTWPQIRDCNN